MTILSTPRLVLAGPFLVLVHPWPTASAAPRERNLAAIMLTGPNAPLGEVLFLDPDGCIRSAVRRLVGCPPPCGAIRV